MPITTVSRVRTIIKKFYASSGGAIITVYSNSELIIGDYLIPNYQIISASTYIKNLKAFTQIESLPEIALPNFELEDSDTDKLYKTLDVEWGGARKQLDLFLGSGDNYEQVGSISILNPSGYPFRVYNLMDLFTDNLALELGDNSQVGVQVKNVGYGLLEGEDNITIHGSYVEEIFCLYPEPVTHIIVQVPVSTSATPNPSPTPTPTPTPSPTPIPVPIPGVDMTWIIKTSSYTAVNGDKIIVDNTSTGVVPIITLPASPSNGAEVSIVNARQNKDVRVYSENDEIISYTLSPQFKLATHHKILTLIFLEGFGWVPTDKDALATYYFPE